MLEKEDEEFERQQEQKRKRRRLEDNKDGDNDTNMDDHDNEVEDIDPEFRLDIPFGTQAERERWQSGEMAEVYTDTLRTLLRLQGEELTDSAGAVSHDDSDKKAISTTVATAERAEKAVDVVERMV